MNCRAKAIAAAGTQQGRECNHLVMWCITWNVRGHRDEKRCSILGRYLREWGATMVCLQETMWEWCEVRDCNGVRRGFLDGFLAVNAIGHYGGVVVAWNEATFSRVDAWIDQFSVGVKLKLQSDAFEML